MDAGTGRDPDILPGEMIGGKYCVERVLGRGGMGVVLSARNVLLDERVAIKVLAGAATPAREKRLLLEARATARLKSDHVVRVFDVGTLDSGAPYIVMECLVGAPLSAERCRYRELPVSEVVGWTIEACAGLEVAHRHGIVHRDLKPANLFLEQRADGVPRIKVLDFGIAKLPEPNGLATTANPMGSPVYMSPEQLANERDIDARTDIWGLGVVLYELLTGRTPFDCSSLLDLAIQLRFGAHTAVHELRPDVPLGLSRIVDRCLDKRREARWPSVLELARALEPFRPRAARPECRLDAASLEETLEPSQVPLDPFEFPSARPPHRADFNSEPPPSDVVPSASSAVPVASSATRDIARPSSRFRVRWRALVALSTVGLGAANASWLTRAASLSLDVPVAADRAAAIPLVVAGEDEARTTFGTAGPIVPIAPTERSPQPIPPNSGRERTSVAAMTEPRDSHEASARPKPAHASARDRARAQPHARLAAPPPPQAAVTSTEPVGPLPIDRDLSW